jgi:hypothetical protein
MDVLQGVIDSVSQDTVDGVNIQVVISEDELFADLLAYDPASGTSPSVTVCRKYVRKMFDAYLAARAAAGLPPVS